SEIHRLANDINDNTTFWKDQAFSAIATAQVELGEIQDSLATVAAHPNERLKADILTQVALFQARQGELATALKTAESINDAGSKAEALRRIAHVQAESGKEKEALAWAAKLTSPQDRALALLGAVRGAIAARRQAR